MVETNCILVIFSSLLISAEVESCFSSGPAGPVKNVHQATGRALAWEGRSQPWRESSATPDLLERIYVKEDEIRI